VGFFKEIDEDSKRNNSSHREEINSSQEKNGIISSTSL